MGNLTNDMTRLRGEVDGLKAARVALMQELVQGGKNRTSEVSAMLSDFAGAHVSMSKKEKKMRLAFVSGVKKRVGRLRKEVISDLAGARRAWCGK